MSDKRSQMRLEQGLPLETAGGICNAPTFSENPYCASEKDKFFPGSIVSIQSPCPNGLNYWMSRQK